MDVWSGPGGADVLFSAAAGGGEQGQGQEQSHEEGTEPLNLPHPWVPGAWPGPPGKLRARLHEARTRCSLRGAGRLEK